MRTVTQPNRICQALAYLDIDDFKRVNGRDGLQAGAEADRNDAVARRDRNEFALSFVGADQVGAVGVIAKLRHALLQLADPKLTGVASRNGCATFKPQRSLRARRTA